MHMYFYVRYVDFNYHPPIMCMICLIAGWIINVCVYDLHIHSYLHHHPNIRIADHISWLVPSTNGLSHFYPGDKQWSGPFLLMKAIRYVDLVAITLHYITLHYPDALFQVKSLQFISISGIRRFQLPVSDLLPAREFCQLWLCQFHYVSVRAPHGTLAGHARGPYGSRRIWKTLKIPVGGLHDAGTGYPWSLANY